jgi:hypothetical protein
MSARSTFFPVLFETYCCSRREPSGASKLNLILLSLPVADYSLTGIETSPKDRERDAIERAAICFSSRAGAQPQRGFLGWPRELVKMEFTTPGTPEKLAVALARS